ASLWLFVKANTTPGFRFNRKHFLFYLPALIEIVTETINYTRYQLTGHFVRLLDIKAWFYSTEILPILGMIAALVYYAMNLPRLSPTKKAGKAETSRLFIIKMYGLFTIFLLLTICWSVEV